MLNPFDLGLKRLLVYDTKSIRKNRKLEITVINNFYNGKGQLES